MFTDEALNSSILHFAQFLWWSDARADDITRRIHQISRSSSDMTLTVLSFPTSTPVLILIQQCQCWYWVNSFIGHWKEGHLIWRHYKHSMPCHALVPSFWPQVLKWLKWTCPRVYKQTNMCAVCTLMRSDIQEEIMIFVMIFAREALPTDPVLGRCHVIGSRSETVASQRRGFGWVYPGSREGWGLYRSGIYLTLDVSSGHSAEIGFCLENALDPRVSKYIC